MTSFKHCLRSTGGVMQWGLLWKHIIPQSKNNIYNHMDCRFLCTTGKHLHSNASLQPIQMAFSSYENTKNPSPESSKVLLIMHGMMGSRSNWNSLSKVLHNKTMWKVIAVDARNHGDSPHSPEHTYEHLVEDIRHLMGTLGIKKASFIGHSMGGRAMMMAALKYPELVDKLVVVDISPIGTSPQLMTMGKYFNAMQSIRLQPNIPLSAARKHADQQLSSTISDKGLRDFLIMNLVEKGSGQYTWRINLDALANNFMSRIATFPKITSSFSGPTLFIGGSKSDYLKPEEETDILKVFPAAEFAYVKDAGHLVHVEKPAEFLSLTINFLLKG
ncbi:protein ABHD11-like [Frankliniella occidentalis]|uniref:sn-1-specific diacylglycerol lipase ABHD11 n=1 Tax=Frankliniella occidentalis TaxID=133901 RepID=A0A6J1T695_FRAOC|nr:protein ABHD11-like [Frankliniella occidentalis]